MSKDQERPIWLGGFEGIAESLFIPSTSNHNYMYCQLEHYINGLYNYSTNYFSNVFPVLLWITFLPPSSLDLASDRLSSGESIDIANPSDILEVKIQK